MTTCVRISIFYGTFTAAICDLVTLSLHLQIHLVNDLLYFKNELFPKFQVHIYHDLIMRQ